jgi:hypothetical protein
MEKIIIQVGSKNTGKTEYCKTLLIDKPPKRALVIDIRSEYTEIEKLSPYTFHKVVLNKNIMGIYRHIFENGLDDGKEAYLDIILNYKNGLIISENPAYLFSKVPQELFGLMCINRSKKVGLIVNFLDLGKALHPKIIQNADIYHLYKNIQPIEKFKNLLGGYYELFKKAESMVDERHFCKIDLNNQNLIKECINGAVLN